jgi:hypothetical protein
MVQNLINGFTFSDVCAVKGNFLLYNCYFLIYVVGMRMYCDHEELTLKVLKDLHVFTTPE